MMFDKGIKQYNPPLGVWLDEVINRENLKEYSQNLLVKLCTVPSFIQDDLEALRQAEMDCFDIITRAVKEVMGDAHTSELHSIEQSIQQDSYYTQPAYTKHEDIYDNRFNLLIQPQNQTFSWLFNAHVDVVPPYFPPSVNDGIVKGRGANDNKGGIVLAVLVFKLLTLWKEKSGENLTTELALSFSIDEEIGGNGSLSLLDHLSLRDKSVVVLEPTKLKLHPANRGALWLQISVECLNKNHRSKTHLLLFSIIRELFDVALDIREQYPHPLFTAQDIQICMGMLDGFGKFPASACTEVKFETKHLQGLAEKDLQDQLHSFLVNHQLLNKYVVISPDEKHLEVKALNTKSYEITVFAKGGHMGSKDRGIDAIIKTAFLIDMLESELNLQTKWHSPKSMNIEGGQGFLPSANLKIIAQLIRKACQKAFVDFTSSGEMSLEDFELKVAFDKIHNEAYSSSKNAEGVQYITQALKVTGVDPNPEPLTGWQASCDARIFARDCSDVSTFGAGALEYAHGPDEFVAIDDLIEAAKVLFTAIYIKANANA